MESDLVALLARSGLSDDEFAAGAEMVRQMSARIALADALAAEVCDASGYLPARVCLSAAEYVSLYVPGDAVAA